MERPAVAVKVVNEDIRKKKDTHDLYDEVLKEVEPMLHIRHPYVVTFLGMCSDKTYGPIMVTELCEAGSLEDYLETRGPLSATIRTKFAKQICEGVQAFHDKNIVHRDLKPGNILVTEGLDLKITDFGLVIDLNRSLASAGGAGTILYMAPEAFDPKAAKGLTTKADIWAVGAIILQVHGVSLSHLFVKLIQLRQAPDIPESIPSHAKAIIIKCFALDPADRPTAGQELTRTPTPPPRPTPQPMIKRNDIFEASKAGDEQSCIMLINKEGIKILDKREGVFKKTPFLVAAGEGHVGVMSVIVVTLLYTGLP
ncbi:unnamed protein product [Vitrella brassicaformis CCMP3155]|uniref:Protein kinase domain-containing protein n=1 Tax=Vitrella brassicaformis (strain CCMP3155) TaxID=1169540 RepID=A0A0G4EHW9_VITBC|nr:unnamed protein product [Vitrella brassicaformis CCMP3155]|eukprot:CEL95524.1 unnamed protein product [Vitrella brassicaformis CCMP3155]